VGVRLPSAAQNPELLPGFFVLDQEHQFSV